MNPNIEKALESDRLIDITTLGRKSGNPHRIEIGFYYQDGDLFITGMPPRKRDWYANLVANPVFTFHLKQSLQADVPARAEPIVNEDSRRRIFTNILKRWNREQDLDLWVENSPLVEITLEIRASGSQDSARVIV